MMMTHLRTICAWMMVSAVTATMTSVVYADDSSDHSASDTHVAKAEKVTKTVATAAKKTKAGAKASTKASTKASSGVAGQTDIVAKVDLPMVTNITPWKDAEESVPKNILEFSALKDSLTPTDRDRLAGEIRYTSILNQPVDQK